MLTNSAQPGKQLVFTCAHLFNTCSHRQAFVQNCGQRTRCLHGPCSLHNQSMGGVTRFSSMGIPSYDRLWFISLLCDVRWHGWQVRVQPEPR